MSGHVIHLNNHHLVPTSHDKRATDRKAVWHLVCVLYKLSVQNNKDGTTVSVISFFEDNSKGIY